MELCATRRGVRRCLAWQWGGLALACVLAKVACGGDLDTLPQAERDVTPAVKAAAASKLGLLGRMLEGDVMTKRVESSGNPLAQEKLHQARAVHQRAAAQQGAGAFSAADQSANEALRLVREALKAADNKVVDAARLKAEFQSRRERVLGFRDAYTRIQAEKTRSRGGMLDEGELETLVTQADALARQGRWEEGGQLLARAGVLLEQALTRLRDKETLVHELKFASAEEELQYERNRNHSYALLLDLVVSEKRTAGLPELVQRAVAANQAALARADEAVRASDTSGALRILEGATAALAQTLRMAGLPVP